MGSGVGQPGRGADLGYARVSAAIQSLERQLDALAAAGIPARRTWAGKKADGQVIRDEPPSHGSMHICAAAPSTFSQSRTSTRTPHPPELGPTPGLHGVSQRQTSHDW